MPDQKHGHLYQATINFVLQPYTGTIYSTQNPMQTVGYYIVGVLRTCTTLSSVTVECLLAELQQFKKKMTHTHQFSLSFDESFNGTSEDSCCMRGVL